MQTQRPDSFDELGAVPRPDEAPVTLATGLGADARLAAAVATRATAVFVVGETALALWRYAGATTLGTKLRLGALAVTLSVLAWLGIAAALLVAGAAPRLWRALRGRRGPLRSWLVAAPVAAGGARPPVAAAWAVALGATAFLLATQRAAFVLALYLRERQLLAFAIALAALAVGLGALWLSRRLRAPLAAAGSALGARLGVVNPLGRWRAAAALACALVAAGLALAWPHAPALRAVILVPWWLACALVGAGVAWGLARPAGPRSPSAPRRRARVALALAGVLALAVPTALWWGADPRTKYVAVTASPAFDRLIAALRWASDVDRDGYGSLLGENDCAPWRRDVRPFAVDVPDNGVDENCDGHDFSLRDLPAPTGPRPGVPPAFLRPWNVLLITIDTMRYDRTSFGGYRDGPKRRDTTPRLAELVARSVSFSHAQAPSAGTMASIPALLTSRFFHSGIALDEKVPPRRPPRIRPENLLLPEVMKAAGFATGVVASHDYWNDWGLDQGVDDYDNTIGARPNPFLIAADKVTDRSLAWISRRGQSRWFLWAHYIDPHGRYVAHPNVVDWGTSEPDLYDAELRWTDREVGRLLDELGRLPGGDRTIVIVTSDHGDSMGEHGIPLGTHGTALYREMLHVPLVFYIPDNPHRTVGGAVSILDVFPTVVELCGLHVDDARFEGQSLVPQLFYGQIDEARIVFAETNAGTPQRAAISGRHKLIYYLKNNLYEFFDLTADPWEKQNLAPAAPPEMARYRDALEGWIERVMYARDPLFNQAVQKLREVLLPAAPAPALASDVVLGELRVVGASATRKDAGWVDVDVFYRVERAPAADLAIGLTLTRAGATTPEVVMSPRVPAEGTFPPRRWRPGEWIRDRFSVPLTAGASSLTLELRTSQGQTAVLGTLAIPLNP